MCNQPPNIRFSLPFFFLVKKIFQLITSAAANLHKIDAHIENAYQTWKSFYKMVAQLGSTASNPAPVAVAEASAEAVADELPATPAPVAPAPVAE
jgi:hypothetical protein